VRNLAPVPNVLHGSGASCRVRTWSGDATVAQIIMYHDRRPPTAEDVHRWCADLAAVGFDRVRTGALYGHQADRLLPFGFAPLQRLALLEHSAPGDVPRPDGPTERLHADEEQAASVVDQAAFAWPWSLDAAAIAEVRSATPRHHARAIHRDGRLVAFAVSGRDGRLGFLQRLAVDPAAQRAGLGRRLVLDSLRWAARRRVARVLVNTHVDNDAALRLYETTGFVRMNDELVVLERDLGADR
jgi:ribosomal protein S18 acetylase RimI-like enzyme